MMEVALAWLSIIVFSISLDLRLAAFSGHIIEASAFLHSRAHLMNAASPCRRHWRI